MLQSVSGATVGNIPKSRNEISVHVVCVFADDSSHTSIKVSSVGIREGNFCLFLSLSLPFCLPPPPPHSFLPPLFQYC